MTATGTPVVPVILCGGAGTRLWPLSRQQHPKQFLSLTGEHTLLQETARRVADRARFASPIMVTGEDHRFTVAGQLLDLGLEPGRVILEPVARNTAPAVAAAALLAEAEDPEAVLLVLPSDHLVGDVAAFLAAVDTALAGALAERALLTFAMLPDRPETGYGYIRLGDPLEGHPGVRRVAAFVEKPDRPTAERFLAAGDHAWNSGMFLFRARDLMAEMERHAPQVAAAARAAVAGAEADGRFLRLDPESFAEAPSISLDYAVMEPTQRALTVPAEMGWSDVGAFSELWSLADHDPAGNALAGDVVALDSRDCLLRSDGPLTAVVGVRDLVVVSTEDAVLVAPRDNTQAVRRLVEHLAAQGRQEVRQPRRVYRPWGHYQALHAGARFQVKQLTVNPGARLSLQAHYHRAEHWVVVNGTARVSRDEETFLVRENESVFLPVGCRHRLENPGKVPLELIEVQSGPYLGEDDIVRFEDAYGRS